MSLEPILEIVFKDGCGVSRPRALKSPRFAELLQSSPRISHVSQHEVAEMMLLGELLADKAYLTLPPHIRKMAEGWETLSSDEQLYVLSTLLVTLTSQEWRRNTSRGLHDGENYSCLPHKIGSWQRGSTMPNCLGLAQMLVGFARAANAEHCLVNVIIDSQAGVMALSLTILREIEASLEKYADTELDKRVLRRNRESQEQNILIQAELSLTHQLHHALMIRLKDCWMIVDPYLGRLYAFHGDSRRITRMISVCNSRPNRTALSFASQTYSDSMSKRALEIGRAHV